MNKGGAGATPRFIGGYQVLRVLPEPSGGGGGRVLLVASLDRGDRAVIRLLGFENAVGPSGLAALARSAFAASLLRHPNIARVRGIGTSKGGLRVVNEYVEGRTLAELAGGGIGRENTSLAILHTSRALQALHSRGLPHGRVHERNVRYDGLGLFKLLDTGRSVPCGEGTDRVPADLEAAFNADRQALGLMCERVIGGLPASESADLQRFLKRMIGGDNEESYRDLPTAIRTLEGLLGVPRLQSQLSAEESGEDLAHAARIYVEAPSARLKKTILAAVWGLLGLLLVLMLVMGRWLPAARLVGLCVSLGFALFLAQQLGRGGGLLSRLRVLSMGLRIGDLVVMALTVVVLFGVLSALGELTLMIAMIVCSIMLAVAFRLVVDRPLEEEREPAVAAAKAELANLRADGLDEVEIRRFYARSLGRKGRGIFEALFGERARREAESSWMQPGGGRFDLDDVSTKVRDKFQDWLDSWLSERRDERLCQLFRETEENRLCAQGVNLLTARRRARRIGMAVVAVAGEIRRESVAGGVPAIGPRIELAANQAEAVLLDHEVGTIGRPWRVLSWLLGLTSARVRFLVGVVLVAGFAVWAHQNELITGQEIQDLATKAASVRDLEAAEALGQELRSTVSEIETDLPTRPLEVSGLPRSVASFLSGLAPGLAGLLLLVSSCMSGRFLGLAILPGVALILAGTSLGLSLGVSLAVGLAFAVLGIVAGRRFR